MHNEALSFSGKTKVKRTAANRKILLTSHSGIQDSCGVAVFAPAPQESMVNESYSLMSVHCLAGKMFMYINMSSANYNCKTANVKVIKMLSPTRFMEKLNLYLYPKPFACDSRPERC